MTDPKNLLASQAMGEEPKVEFQWCKHRLSDKKQREIINERRFETLESMYHDIIHLRNAVLEGDKFNIEHRLWSLALNVNRARDRNYMLDTHCRYFLSKHPGTVTREDFSWGAKWDDKMEHRINQMWEHGDRVMKAVKKGNKP